MKVLVLGGTRLSGPIPLTEDSPLREQHSPHGEAYEKRWVEEVVLGDQEVVPLEDAMRRTVDWQRTNTPEKVDPADFDYAAEDAVLAEMGAADR